MLEDLTQLAHETGYDCEAMRGALSVARDAFLSSDPAKQGTIIEAARSEAYARLAVSAAELMDSAVTA